MKVSKLISRLRKFDPNANVYLLSDSEGNIAARLVDIFKEPTDWKPGIYLEPSDDSWEPLEEPGNDGALKANNELIGRMLAEDRRD